MQKQKVESFGILIRLEYAHNVFEDISTILHLWVVSYFFFNLMILKYISLTIFDQCNSIWS